MPKIQPKALFVGLCTLDVIQLVDRVPHDNEKRVAHCQTVAAGGPATNAAVAFAALGGAPTLVTGVGSHPLAGGIRADLTDNKVQLVDVATYREIAPSVSSIMVTAETGERAVVSTNAVADRLSPPTNLNDLLEGCHAVQVDGHHPKLAVAALVRAKTQGDKITIMDGGSWKPDTDRLLPLLDVVVCSADFCPPGMTARHPALIAEYLRDYGVPWIAITQGEAPVLWWGPDNGAGQVAVPQVRVVDTLGAGDVFHGAVTFSLAALVSEAPNDPPFSLKYDDFVLALTHAAATAGLACSSFGTRSWLVDAALDLSFAPAIE